MTEPSDCRSDEGIIIGLIDGIIAASRVVARHLREHDVTIAAHRTHHRDLIDALADIRRDEDVALVAGREGEVDSA
jgi:hypothetical protein